MLRRKKTIVVNDRMQKNYRYNLSEPAGRNFDLRFKPQLTPKQMLELGIFCGRYLRDCQKEFPKSWFSRAKFAKEKKNCDLNYFRVRASMPLSYWRQKDWIHPDDPRGWFQWYCRYYLGRRHEDDDRQIKRWLAMKRHIMQIKKNCRPHDINCRPRQKQALLHWAYDTRKF